MINTQTWKMVLWGHKTHYNTFYYIHHAYNRAFKHLGAQVYWFDDDDNVSNFDFSNSFFITEGQVDKKIPLRDDCFYLLHNCTDDKYKPLLDKNRAGRMQTYTDDVLKYKIPKVEDCIHADYDGKCLYFPWATDLLPHEIEANKPSQPFNKDSRVIHWVGTVGEGTFGNMGQINPFIQACNANGIRFDQVMLVSLEENIRRIKASYMAPTIVGKWQHEVGYIPCRLFKNISYGQMTMTNSPRLYELCQHKIIHNNDTHQLFYDARDYLSKMPLSELHSLMDWVKDKHTYLNRIDTVLTFCNKILGG
jgi:hypothetical protein